jgi:ArsR family transcriptional regulator
MCQPSNTWLQFAFVRNSETTQEAPLRALKALASAPRLDVLAWLKDPVANFPPQVDGDLVADGVCGDFLRDRMGVSASTASRHLTVLVDAGLLVATRKKGWTFYRRDEAALAALVDRLRDRL